VNRRGIAATRVHVDGTEARTHRHWTVVQALFEASQYCGREHAVAAFPAWATAEAAVHCMKLEQVHFHEVRALDGITDIVGACAGFSYLGLDEVMVSSVAVGGRVRAAHGIAHPGSCRGPAARGPPQSRGPAYVESATPTGAALVTTSATGRG
jgi:hypothetical protein